MAFQLESCEEFQAFSRNHFARIPRQVGISIRSFRSQIVRSFSIYITPSWELQSETRPMVALTFLWKCEVRTILTFSNWKTPLVVEQHCVVYRICIAKTLVFRAYFSSCWKHCYVSAYMNWGPYWIIVHIRNIRIRNTDVPDVNNDQIWSSVHVCFRLYIAKLFLAAISVSCKNQAFIVKKITNEWIYSPGHLKRQKAEDLYSGLSLEQTKEQTLTSPRSRKQNFLHLDVWL